LPADVDAFLQDRINCFVGERLSISPDAADRGRKCPDQNGATMQH
jgi:hypothetical protein